MRSLGGGLLMVRPRNLVLVIVRPWMVVVIVAAGMSRIPSLIPVIVIIMSIISRCVREIRV